MSGVEWSEPLWLFLLPPVIALALWSERGSRLAPGVRRTMVRAARTLSLAALVVALAGPRIARSNDRLTVVFAVDVSRSVGAEGLEWTSRYLAEAARHLGKGDRAGVVAFGEDALVDSHPEESWKPGEILARPGRDATDLEEAVRVARGLVPQDEEARLVLVTDGLETRGAIENALSGNPGPLDVVWVPLAAVSGPDAVVESVSAPERVTEGSPHKVRVVVRSSSPTDALLRVYEGAALISAAKVRLDDGQNVFTIERQAPQESGPLLYRAEVEADADATPQNNRAAAVVRVEGRPRVLALDLTPDSLRPLERALSGADMSVTVGSPAALPADLLGLSAYDAIVLADAPATDFSEGQLGMLRSYVDATGGGLVMLGGPDSFGPGGYWESPVEAALPVDMDVTDRRNYPSLGIVLCIDKSGSMAGQKTAQKIEVAKAAAAAVADQLSALDRIGVVAFDAAAKWVVEPRARDSRSEFLARLGTLRAGGGTDAYPAMQLARDALVGMNVRTKHVVLLTDGQLAARDHEGLAAAMRAAGITVSTVAVGSDADLYTLERIARVGGGEFYLARDVQRVPRIFLREAFRVSRAWLVEEPFQAVTRSDHTVLTGVDLASAPPLEGYVVTTAKPAASHLALTPEGDPLLSVWRYGLGKAASFTSDAKARWGASWLRWSGYTRFWTQLVRWVARGDEARGRLNATTRIADNSLSIAADLYADDGAAINGARMVAVVLGPDGSRREARLRQVGPGRYETAVEARETGVYLAAVLDQDEQIGTTTTAVVPYSPEFGGVDRAPDSLERLVAAGRVHEVRDVDDLFVHRGAGARTYRSIVPWFLATACVLLVAEVAARKLSFGSAEPRPVARLAPATTVGRLRRVVLEQKTRRGETGSAPGAAAQAPEVVVVRPARRAPAPSSQPAPPPEGGQTEPTRLTARLLALKRGRRGS